MKNLSHFAQLFAAFPLSTTNYTWQSGATGNWSGPAKWSPNGVPAIGDNATVNSGAVTLTQNIQLNNLNISGSSLTGNFKITGASNATFSTTTNLSGTDTLHAVGCNSFDACTITGATAASSAGGTVSYR